MNREKVYLVSFGHDRNGVEWLTDFVFPWREEAEPGTKFRAWHDRVFLHFEFEVIDRDIVLDHSEDRDEQVLGSDRVELFFSPTGDLSQPYFGFEMDPRGQVYDYRATFHRQFESDWTLESLRLQGDMTDEGYRVEGVFPLEALRGMGCLRDGEMVTGVYRAEFSHEPDSSVRQDWISWVDPRTESVDFHVPETFGRFVFSGL